MKLTNMDMVRLTELCHKSGNTKQEMVTKCIKLCHDIAFAPNRIKEEREKQDAETKRRIISGL